MRGTGLHEQWRKLLCDPDVELQRRALTEIGRSYFQPTEPLEQVSPLEGAKLGGPVRTRGAGKPGLPVALRDVILEKLKAKVPNIRAEAVLALVHWEDDRTVNAIKDALVDPEITVRLAAIQAAAMLEHGELVDDLVSVAKNDQEEVVRAKAVDAIKWIQRETEEEEEKPAAAIRARGPAQRSLSQILDEIGKTDRSSYVRFLAGRPAGPRSA